MRVAILSDIHSNREALKEVLKRLQSLQIDEIVCLGDIVGYNADPDLCVEELFPLLDVFVRGNHDKSVSSLKDIEHFNEVARQAVCWTRDRMKQANLDRLEKIKEGPLLVNKKFLICHGSPMDEDLYISYLSDALESFRYIHKHYPQVKICFFGHTHIPLIIEKDGRAYSPTGEFILENDRSYLINPGSVGQPRDGIPMASFGVFDDDKMKYEHFRIPFAIDETQKKILAAGLPPFLARRLAVGK